MLVAVADGAISHSIKNLVQQSDTLHYHLTIQCGERFDIVVSIVGMGLSFCQVTGVAEVTKPMGNAGKMCNVY